MSHPPPPPPNGPFQPPHGQYPGSGAPPPWPPQGSWPGRPAEPPKRGNGWKFVLGAVALVAAIAVTVAVTVVVTGDGSGGDGPPTAAPPTGNGANSDIASANDTGPVEVITEDPSCAPVGPILETRAAAQDSGWGERDPSVPATEWTPEVRVQHEEVGESMRKAADQLVPIAKMTPHRVMRELYEQLIVYSRAYADSIPTYTSQDDNLALVSVSAATAISGICAAIDTGSAAARAPLVALPAAAPSQIAPVADPNSPKRFLTEPNLVCADWERALTQFQTDTEAWVATDPDIPAGQWKPEQQAINDNVAPAMSRFANQVRALGAQSENPVLQDFAELSAQYRLAYVEALPTYMPGDKYLSGIANLMSYVINRACLAVSD